VSNKKILTVEDDPDLRRGCHLLLKNNHYDSFVAVDALSAISEALKQRPDLILLDLGLPGGDGFVVMDRLRANTYLSLIPVVVISARDVRGNKERALKAGARAYVQKPWNDAELLAIIAELTGDPVPSALRPN
jgi:DNA-binding response OmpR family regulator